MKALIVMKSTANSLLVARGATTRLAGVLRNSTFKLP
jgi:hypothetical protein